jgi:hypothetical protein
MRWALVAGLAACGFRPSLEGQIDAPASSGDEGSATQMDAPATPFSPACSALPGYTAHNTHAYKRTSDQPKFDDAIEGCQRDGAYLVRIEDATEGQYIASTYGEVWVGASDQETEATFRNVSSDNQIITYDNFTGSEPNDNNNDEDCVYAGVDAHWNDTACGDTSHKALCECDPDYHAPAVPMCRSLSGSKIFESRMYFVHTTPATWSDAHDQCAAVGAYLMVPSDDTENSIIQDSGELDVGSDTWIGASQAASAWAWADQSPYSYQKWTTNPPAGTNQCARVHTNDKWDPDTCTNTHPFVCECPP